MATELPIDLDMSSGFTELNIDSPDMHPNILLTVQNQSCIVRFYFVVGGGTWLKIVTYDVCDVSPVRLPFNEVLEFTFSLGSVRIKPTSNNDSLMMVQAQGNIQMLIHWDSKMVIQTFKNDNNEPYQQLGGCFEGNSMLIHESGGGVPHVRITGYRLKPEVKTCNNILATLCLQGNDLSC